MSIKKKLEVVIDKCAACPTNESLYVEGAPLMLQWRYFCTRTNPPREISTHLFSIPEFCPLPDAEDK